MPTDDRKNEETSRSASSNDEQIRDLPDRKNPQDEEQDENVKGGAFKRAGGGRPALE